MYLSGVGPKRKDLLSRELGMETYGDLMEHYPYKYVDRSRIYAISEMTGDMPYVQIQGRIISWDIYDTGRRQKRYVAHFFDGTGFVDLVWFQGGQYAYKNYNTATEYIVFGKPGIFQGRYQFSHPDIDDAKTLIQKMPPQPETLPSFLIEPNHLISRDQALRWIHYPHNNREMQLAQMRLKFEELFYVQLNILRYVGERRR